jgi:hypothetical protein
VILVGLETFVGCVAGWSLIGCEQMTEHARRRWLDVDVRTGDAYRVPIGATSVAGRPDEADQLAQAVVPL